MIQYGRHSLSEDDIQAVADALRSDFLTQGPLVPCFEKTLTDWSGASYAVATNSATSALHIACLALGLGPGDRLWTSPTTFVASANCALYCGATVDFVDIDPRTYNISTSCLAEKLALAETEGTLPKIVVPVHMCGQSCDMEAIHGLAQRYDFRLIEDASHAIGASFKDIPVGKGKWSDITIYSFHPVKIITTGEGGAALTNRSDLAERMRILRSHGISHHRGDMQPRPADEIWNYQQIGLGYNYRMTDIHAALGISQIRRLQSFVEARRKIAQRYDSSLSEMPLKTPWQHPDARSCYHLYPVRLELSKIGKTQRQIYTELHADGIIVNLHYIPVYRQPYYEALGFHSGYCPEAEKYHREALSLPIFADLREDEQEFVIRKLKDVLAA